MQIERLQPYACLRIPADSQLQSQNFTFGVATAAFQIEGAAADRLESIWDRFCRRPNAIRDGSDGLVACDHFHLWEQDIALISEMGVDAYRFSISWPRVVTLDCQPNQQGIDFYLNILKRLKSLNIKAYVTLYHWDLPQHLEDQGGWLNRKTAYDFAHYADVVSQAFGDLVYSYATLNEPFCSAYLGYEIGVHAPGLASPDYGKKAVHHLLLAHGLAMQVLRRNSPRSQSGIVLNFSPCHSLTESEADRKAAALADQHFNHWYIKPILDGSYPTLLDDLPASQKPDIQAGDLAIIAAPIDYIGVNYYTREIYQTDTQRGFAKAMEKSFSLTDMGWEIYPQGLTELLLDLHHCYRLPPVIITENGAAMPDKIENGRVEDLDRLAYYQSHLMAVDQAIREGVDIRGYFAWSLLDNFEWAEGYAKRFGLVYVDYVTQKRIIKTSGLAYQAFLLKRKQGHNSAPDTVALSASSRQG
jgi:beta-glucosidase